MISCCSAARSVVACRPAHAAASPAQQPAPQASQSINPTSHNNLFNNQSTAEASPAQQPAPQVSQSINPTSYNNLFNNQSTAAASPAQQPAPQVSQSINPSKHYPIIYQLNQLIKLNK